MSNSSISGTEGADKIEDETDDAATTHEDADVRGENDVAPDSDAPELSAAGEEGPAEAQWESDARDQEEDASGWDEATAELEAAAPEDPELTPDGIRDGTANAAADAHATAIAAQHHDEDHGSQGSGFAAMALRLLILILVVFGVSLWLVPMLAPHMPARIAKHIMPGQERLDARLAAIDQEVSGTIGKAESRLVGMEAQIASLTEMLAAAEATAAAAREEAAQASAAAEKSAEAALASGVSESVVSAAEASAERAAEAADTATTAATEAGKVASAATRDTASLARQMTSFEARLSGVTDEVGAIEDALASGTAGGGAALPELTAAVAALRSRVDGMVERLEAEYVTRELADGFATQDDLRSARTALSADLQAGFDRLPEPSTVVTAPDLESFRTAVDGKIADLSDRVALAEKGVQSAAEAAVVAAAASDTAVGQVETAIRDASLKSAIAALDSRLRNGAPFAGALTEIESLTGDPAPEALATLSADGVATADALLRGFGRNAQNALAADIRASSEEGILGQASARLQSIVAGRPKSEQAGEDTGAILSRVEARLKDGALAEALAEAEGLPDAAKSAMADWLDELRARVTAENAAADFVAGFRGSQG